MVDEGGKVGKQGMAVQPSLCCRSKCGRDDEATTPVHVNFIRAKWKMKAYHAWNDEDTT